MTSEAAPGSIRVVDGRGEAAMAAAARVWAEATAARDDQPVPAVEVARTVIETALAPPDSVLLLAMTGPTVAGFAAVAPTDEPGLAEVHYLGVSPDMWGRGVGSALLVALPARLRGAAFLRLRLSVYVDNTAASRLYERHGWTPQGAPAPHPRSGRLEQQYVLPLTTTESPGAVR